MGATRRLIYFLTGALMVVLSVFMIRPDPDGYQVVLNFMKIALLLSGIKHLHYYFTMARYMVGGIYIFYKGVFLLDAALFAFSMDKLPRQYAMLYLIGGLAFAGIVGIMHAMEVKRLESGKWVHLLIQAVIQLAFAVICLFFLGNSMVLTFVYGIGMLHSGISRIITAFRRTAIVYVK